jgi:hypothetical protein
MSNILTAPLISKDVDIAEFVDIDTGRMKVPDGHTGMKFSEAAVWASGWWEHKARRAMPDYIPRKGEDYLNQHGIKSGILLGLPWGDLSKNEKLNVIRAWWNDIGFKTHCLGLNPERKTIQ